MTKPARFISKTKDSREQSSTTEGNSKMPAKGSGSGIHKDAEGYIVIHRRGPNRSRFAHRAFVDWQLAECGQLPLTAAEEVHHLCRNRSCWPPADGHLLIMPEAMHHFIDGGSALRRRRQRKVDG